MEKIQQIIAALEEELRTAGFEYSAEFLKIASSSLHQEVALLGSSTKLSETLLESIPSLQ